jgi:hypothetical protein
MIVRECLHTAVIDVKPGGVLVAEATLILR